MSVIDIPRIAFNDETRWDPNTPGPGWMQCAQTDRATGVLKPSKPIIKCKCGVVTGIGLHHVHADGRVTASFWHATAAELEKMGPDAAKGFMPGCGWHVHIRLLDYDQGDHPPEPRK